MVHFNEPDTAGHLHGPESPEVGERVRSTELVVDGPPVARLRELEMVEGAAVLDERHTLAWGPPGAVFGPWLDELGGSHGSPRCDTQVAVVGGGHPSVTGLAAAVESSRPPATWWAPTIAGLLGFALAD